MSSPRAAATPRTRSRRARPPWPVLPEETDAAAGAQPRRPSLPGPGRRGEADGAGAQPGVDRPQRVRPGCDAHRDVRVHDRPADLSAEPDARPAPAALPRPDRGVAAAADDGGG